jgi:ribosomal protein L3 glutamine methyltransferase
MPEFPDLDHADTAGRLIERVAAYFEAADLFFGHGTDNPVDEAAALVFHVMGLDHAGDAGQYEIAASPDQQAAMARLAQARVATRTPLPYLLGEAWFAGLPFHVNPDVLIPRSPIAELIAERFDPWVDPDRVRRILEIGTGSGCIAVACALAFPAARVVATDISAAALAIAYQNCLRHHVSERVRLVLTDHAAGLTDAFDLVIANPPYVPEAELAQLPAEYRHEPGLALASGADGLDSARRILQDAAQLLAPAGVLVLEVGAQWEALQAAYPRLPFNWLEFEYGGVGVGLLTAESLLAELDPATDS